MVEYKYTRGDIVKNNVILYILIFLAIFITFFIVTLIILKKSRLKKYKNILDELDLEKNLIYNKEYALNKIQRRAYNIGEGVIIKTFGSSIDMQKGILNVLKTLKKIC